MDGSAAPSLPIGDENWLVQVHHWRAEAREYQSQVYRAERACDERLKDMEQRCELTAQMREASVKDFGALEQRFGSALAGAHQEIERLTSAAANASERAKRSDHRVVDLLGESEEAARLMSQVTVKFDHQVDINTSLRRKLQKSEADAEKLRGDLEAALLREAQQRKLHDAAEATVAQVMSRFTEEVKAESRMAEDAVESKSRLRIADKHFQKHASELEEKLQLAREEKTLLGRKCAESYQVAALHANAGEQWQQRSHAAEQELIRAGLNQHHLWEAAKRTRAEQWRQQEQIRHIEEQRDRAAYGQAVSDQARRDLTGWVVNTLDEVNRSAHVHTFGDPFAPGGRESDSFQGQAWVDMLESFREDQQTRSGYGSRTRAPGTGAPPRTRTPV